VQNAKCRKLLYRQVILLFRNRSRVFNRDVLDFTSMYPTIFCLQRLDTVLTSPVIDLEDATADVRAFVAQMASSSRCVSLFDPELWPKLNCMVQVDPGSAILPIRMCEEGDESYTIAVSPIQTKELRWYTLADVLAGMRLGGLAPTIHKAMRVVTRGKRRSKTVLFRNKFPLRSSQPFFKTIVEERQKIKNDPEADEALKPLEMVLKLFLNSGSYGNICRGQRAARKHAQDGNTGHRVLGRDFSLTQYSR
jgi:hypothetical protein